MKQNIQEYLQKIKQNIRKFSEKLQRTIRTRANRGISIKTIIAVAVPLVVLIAGLWFFVHYSVRNVIVLGNVHYTNEEITHLVQRGLFGNNTLIVSRGQKTITPDNMALVDRIDVEMKDSHTLQITVQERQLIGYVQFLDCYLYFDGDGRVMDSVVKEEKEGDDEPQALTAEAVGKNATAYVAAMKEAPLIRGLNFAWAQMHEILPVEKQSVFNTILGITRMVNKYNIAPKAVVFDEELNITLEYEDVIVNLGQDNLMEEKLTRVAAILPSLEGKHGMLHLEDYDGSSDNIVFSTLPLEAEGIEDEEEDDQTEDSEEEYSHEYALYVSDHDNLKRRGNYAQQTPEEDAQQQLTMPDEGNTQQQLTMPNEENTQQQTVPTQGDLQQNTTQPAGGNTQQNTTQPAEGNTQQNTTQPTGNALQQGNSQTAPQGSTGNEQIQIDKPVLNNLP